jgi:N-methylhydantoinase A
LRSGFTAGDRLDGPAVIEELGATILLYPGDKLQVNERGHLVIEVGS